jgi:diaminohydroxyphosphoribosylaminopyrimidine deaminase / 5-amino-6-(5-phosphoribosylamino)uracil reductase
VFIDIIRTVEESGNPIWITDEIARIAVHKQRSIEGSIFIGTKTAIKDNPSLTLRDWYGQQPIRIVTDLNNRLPSNLNFFDGKVKTITLSNKGDQVKNNSFHVRVKNDDVIKSLLEYLHSEKILSVVVEGGSKTLQHFIDLNLWDEAHVYTGRLIFEKGINAPVFDGLQAFSSEKFPQSELIIYRNYKE